MDKIKEKQDKSEAEANEIAKKQRLDDIMAIINTPAGLRFFQRFMEDGHIFHTTFTGNSVGYFNEGARNFVLKYFKDICEVAPEKIHQLIIKEKTHG